MSGGRVEVGRAAVVGPPVGGRAGGMMEPMPVIRGTSMYSSLAKKHKSVLPQSQLNLCIQLPAGLYQTVGCNPQFEGENIFRV